MTSDAKQNEPPEVGAATRKDLAESTAAITTHVDNVTEAVRTDLAERAEVIRDEIVSSNAHAESTVEQKTEAVRSELAAETEARRRSLAIKDEQTRSEMAKATEEVRVILEAQTEALRHNLEQRAIDRRELVDQKFRDYRRWFLIATAIMLAANTALFFLYLNPRAGQSLLVIGEIQVHGDTDVCPGDYIDFSFEMDVSRPGVYELDLSVFRVSPPPSIAVFSERQTFVIGQPRTFVVNRHWQVPPLYHDEQTNETIEFIPGVYTRDIAVSTTSRNTLPSTQFFEFTIKDSCES